MLDPGPRQTGRHYGTAFNHPKRIGSRKKFVQQGIGQGMASLVSLVVPKDRRARQSQITKCVQHLVSHSLIRMAQAPRTQHLIPIHNYGVFVCTAKRLADRAHGRYIRRATEGTAITKFTNKAAVGQIQSFALHTDRRVFEFNMEGHCQTARRTKPRPA